MTRAEAGPREEPGVPNRGRVERTSLLFNVLLGRPEAARVLMEELGLPCYDCPVAETETVERALCVTGKDVDAIVARLNACPLGAPLPVPPPAAGPAAGASPLAAQEGV